MQPHGYQGVIEADADLRLIRRLIRDTEERARTMQSVLSQYLNTVKPMHELYVEPSRKNADLVIPMWRENPVALDMLIARVRSHILKIQANKNKAGCNPKTGYLDKRNN